MVNRGTNHLGIDRSKTAGGRKRRQASKRKRRLREANLYRIAVKAFGLFRDGNVWKLTAMKVTRSEERLVSDRRGGTTSEVVTRAKVKTNDPTDGFVIDTFDTKKEATRAIHVDSWKKYDTGAYYVWDGYKATKVDRDDWCDWLSQRCINTKL
jgi:hypothetical protein